MYLDHWNTEPASGKWLDTSAKFSAMMNWPAATTGQVQMKAPAERGQAEREQREDAGRRRDVAEGHRERAERAEGALEFLLVAEPRQVGGVPVMACDILARAHGSSSSPVCNR